MSLEQLCIENNIVLENLTDKELSELDELLLSYEEDYDSVVYVNENVYIYCAPEIIM